MKNISFSCLCVLAIAALVLHGAAPAAEAACDASALSVCSASILGSSPPSSACCSEMKAQVPCFCQYQKDPNLSSYIGKGKKVAAACHLSVPKC